jgi:hypothetical protein
MRCRCVQSQQAPNQGTGKNAPNLWEGTLCSGAQAIVKRPPRRGGSSNRRASARSSALPSGSSGSAPTAATAAGVLAGASLARHASRHPAASALTGVTAPSRPAGGDDAAPGGVGRGADLESVDHLHARDGQQHGLDV